jgi:hypothetical protein
MTQDDPIGLTLHGEIIVGEDLLSISLDAR